MSRCIGCEVNGDYQLVWHYGLGNPSDMFRISTELGIGEYQKTSGLDDMLILIRSDVEKLESQIQVLKKTATSHEDKRFIAMLEAIRDFMIFNSGQEKFIFESDL